MGAIPVIGTLALRDYLVEGRVVARLADPRGRRLTVRAKHLPDVELDVDGRGGPPSLTVPSDEGWAKYSGAAAMQTAGVLLAGANRFGANGSDIDGAVRHIERAGDAAHYLARASAMGSARLRLTSVVGRWRGLGAMQLSGVERLALEMAVHEESERRAMEGELAALESAWREAEEIARIADAL